MARATTPPTDHPGTFVAEELEARGWLQADLAYVLGIDVTQLNKIVKGNTDVTADTAVALGEAFGMEAEFFLNLQWMYDLKKARKADPGVRTRAAWLSVFPVREMIKRGWIEDADPALLDLQMMRFFEKNRVEDIPFVSDAQIIGHAAKKTDYSEITATQYVWLYRVRKLADQFDFPRYSASALRDSLASIRAHLLDKDDLIHIPDILRKCGVRLAFVESLPGSKIDGVCLWLSEGQPVIGLSLRLNRLDNFCFVLRHELEHVLRGDGRDASFNPIDVFEGNVLSDVDSQPECERIANEAAGEFCVPRDLLNTFVLRKSPFISERDMLTFAARVGINPAIAVGQIQHKINNYAWLRKYQTSIKEYLLDWECRDGWGYQAPSGI